jgi:Major capsid protein Gp23
MFLSEQLTKKWEPVLNHDGLGQISDKYKRAVTAVVLENQEKALREERTALFETPANNIAGTGSSEIDRYDPILISLVRRALPNLMAYDVAGVQPMTGPTGLIFAMKSKYSTQGGTEALFNEADTDFSGAASPAHEGSNPVDGTYTTGLGIATVDAEQLGETGGTDFNEMAFSIEKTTVTAKTRALKAEYTVELAQDLKAIHGLDAEGELSNILSQEILAEINREVIRTIYKVAKTGAASTATAGTFDLDVDSNGRWSVERFKGLLFNIERDANVIAQDTRRGKGNFIICSSDVAAALAMAGMLDTGGALNGSPTLQVDDTGNTFVGTLNGRYKVFVDPYSANTGAASQFYVVGYKGANAYDAGIFYCPYVPLQMVRAIDPNTFQPKIGFKTRYGMIANPFVTQSNGTTDGDTFTANRNQYYRRVKVTNLM